MKNHIKRLSFALLGTCVSIAMFGTAFAAGTKPYFEGHMGIASVNNVDGGTLISAGGFNAAVSGKFEFNSAFAFGGEVGLANIGGSNFRVGASVSAFEAELESVSYSGALSYNGTVLVAVAGTATAADVKSVGLDFDNDVRLYSLNGYYDFDKVNGMTPYIGAGVGLADIEHANDNELAFSAHVGINFELWGPAYLGIKGSYHHANGPTDLIGIKYDDVSVWTATALFGVKY